MVIEYLRIKVAASFHWLLGLAGSFSQVTIYTQQSMATTSPA